jgi:hypothetical protein
MKNPLHPGLPVRAPMKGSRFAAEDGKPFLVDDARQRLIDEIDRLRARKDRREVGICRKGGGVQKKGEEQPPALRNYLTTRHPDGALINATELLSQLPQLCQSGARLPDKLS